ncbi:glycosyltransferase family 2 protein [Psychromarinibacter halotolerans]|uniref:Glycosyltransferase family 2 protein n=1 Tax=Psychromarinibacter halotolerans TaxID=1775175 RepID=A0ABV7H063_9RHOB|nr:glycosyltransferase family 2 protein [Psychromarinibacter halotolerans]MDF0596170.1 glycosyltransferase family 2 protein [Psychromarinibacter halotolerans]
MTIISLSSIPSRFDKLEPTLTCLLRQDAQIDAIQLHIPWKYRRFPDWDGVLPDVPKGVEIVRVEEDLGPATKVLFAAQAHRGQDVDIILCDDDRRYKPHWAQTYIDARRDHPDCCLAIAGFEADRYGQSQMKNRIQPRAKRRSRGMDWGFQLKMAWEFLFPPVERKYLREPTRRLFRQSGYVDCFEGFAGAMVRPEFFDDEAFDIPPVVWTVDDVWLSGHLARMNVPIWIIAGQHDTQHTPAGISDALYMAEIEGADRDEANKRCIAYLRDTYGIWP